MLTCHTVLADILEKIVKSSKIRSITFGQLHIWPTFHAQPYQQDKTDHPRMVHDGSLKIVCVTEDELIYGDTQPTQ